MAEQSTHKPGTTGTQPQTTPPSTSQSQAPQKQNPVDTAKDMNKGQQGQNVKQGQHGQDMSKGQPTQGHAHKQGQTQQKDDGGCCGCG